MDIKDTDGEKSIWSEKNSSEVCKWASYHAQTLTRTGEGNFACVLNDTNLSMTFASEHWRMQCSTYNNNGMPFLVCL
jgi:hypothetical protein